MRQAKAILLNHKRGTAPGLESRDLDRWECVSDLGAQAWLDRRKHHGRVSNGRRCNGKSVELFRDMLPSIRRVGVFGHATKFSLQGVLLALKYTRS
jgi:hypothetical protein